MLKSEIKFNSILDNNINGNMSDFRDQIKKLTKIEILDLVEYAQGQRGIARHMMINSLRNNLSIN